jgi:hypothetical protein
MKKYNDYEQTETFSGDYERIILGGHICVILKVTVEEKDYGSLMRIAFDIADGENEGFYDRQFKRKQQTDSSAKWPGMYYQTIKDNDLRYFKGFITSIEKSNPTFKWNWNEKELVGKLFGGIFGEEEYMGNDGQVKTSVKCRFTSSIDKVKEGVKVPEAKRLQNPSISTNYNQYGHEVNLDDDIPF